MGLGPGNSVQRNFLPHPYSDFIFAIIVEEYGLVGAGIVMLLYLIILYRVGVIVRRCTEDVPGDSGGRIGAVYRVSSID